MTYDVIIVGGGMAGMTSAIYSARRSLNTLLIAASLGGQMATTPDIENWPGDLSINGAELASNMKTQIEKLGVETKIEQIIKIIKKEKQFELNSSRNSYKSRSVILAFGKIPRSLEIPGEKELMGKGVSYCVNCDGPFFRNKDVAIIGGGNSALDATIMMSSIANKVYLIHRRDQFRGEEYLINKVKSKKNVDIIFNSEASKILGKDKVEGLILNPKKNLNISAVFIEVGYVVNSGLVKKLVKTDDLGQIVVDNYQKTSLPGIFAAGDMTNTPYQQLVIAAGEAATAALSAHDYLQQI